MLDEPTNDLDLETLDLLQEVIADYDGTVLIVSHDRDFLDRTVTMTLGLDGSGHVDIVAGGYADWEAKRTRARRGEGRRSRAERNRRRRPRPLPRRPRARKLCYKDQRDYDLLPARIEELETAIARARQPRRSRPLRQRSARFATHHQGARDSPRAEKDAAEERWLELAEQVEG